MKHSSVKLQTPVEFINLKPFNPLISKCEIKVCWVGDEPNRNKSVITKDTALTLANSLPGSPIVGFWKEETQDFDEHTRELVVKNGKLKMVDVTKPYGFVDLGARVWFQKFLDDGQVEREYLMTEGWLWTGQYPEAKRILTEGNNQSMELDKDIINAHWTKDDNGKPQFFIINEAIISKLCILGEECEPCFEGAQITNVQFSFEDGFKEQLFSMIQEIKDILEKGGEPMYTTYAVEIGDSLWCALHEYLVNNYPHEEDNWCSKYRIEGIYEEGEQKFAILQDCSTAEYFRLNFDISEENGFAPEDTLVEVVKEFVPAEAPLYSLASYEEFMTQYAADHKEEICEKCGKPVSECECEEEEICEKCGKPVSECECEDEDEKVQCVLEEIPEYMELSNNYSALQETYAATCVENEDLKNQNAALTTQVEELIAFKKKVEKEEKMKMINETFCMLDDEYKKDVIENVDTYSLDEIEAKLSILCVRYKVSFDTEEPAAGPTGPTTYNLSGYEDPDDQIPAWVKAVLATQENL